MHHFIRCSGKKSQKYSPRRLRNKLDTHLFRFFLCLRSTFISKDGKNKDDDDDENVGVERDDEEKVDFYTSKIRIRFENDLTTPTKTTTTITTTTTTTTTTKNRINPKQNYSLLISFDLISTLVHSSLSLSLSLSLSCVLNIGYHFLQKN